uniref:Uncharacterized protein n=1 Tax=Heterorhabditis bacteriophora TaxID=37862 RepID=A0A1I7WIC7_HETBA
MFHGNTRHTNRYRGNMDFGDTRPQCSSAKLYRLIKKCVTVTSDVTCSRQLLTSEEKRAPLVTALLRLNGHDLRIPQVINHQINLCKKCSQGS